jgi:hypothetical protein
MADGENTRPATKCGKILYSPALRWLSRYGVSNPQLASAKPWGGHHRYRKDSIFLTTSASYSLFWYLFRDGPEPGFSSVCRAAGPAEGFPDLDLRSVVNQVEERRSNITGGTQPVAVKETKRES